MADSDESARSLHRGRSWHTLVAASCAVFALLLSATLAASQQVDPNLWGTDGAVDAIARSGNTIYIGGSFTKVGPNSGGGVPLNRRTGVAVIPFPRVTGVVHAVIIDGGGGWYIGGAFVAVGGLPRTNIAHILADGRVADWTPNADGTVLALARRGPTLYVGGSFTQIGGRARRYVAELDLGTGRATGWNPAADLQVRALLVDHGRLYAGGDFSNIGGQGRSRVAELEVRTGQATAWNPAVGVGLCSVRALAALGDTIYLGGLFSSVGASQHYPLAAVNATTGLATAWNPVVTGPNDSYYGDPYVSTLAVRQNSIYVGGHFTSIGGQVRGGLAQLDLATGLATAWNPDPGPWTGSFNRDVTALAVTDTTICVAGFFESIGGQARNYVAEVSLETGAATNWDPNANDAVKALAVDGSAVYVAGSFTGMGSQWVQRRLLAAFDATTGAVKDWNPDVDGFLVGALTVAKGRVYAGGYFDLVGGQTRFDLAALDTLTGMVTDWNPTANSDVSSLAVVGDTLYAGGYFTTMSGVARNHLASFDLNTGALTSWDPNANNDVFGLAVSGNRVYIAGFFSAVGGISRRYGAAAVDATTGAVTDWDPQSDDWVNAIAVIGSHVIVGGRFNTIGGQPRSNLAALDAATGQATDWIANTNSTVNALVTIADTLFVGGLFSSIGGQPRYGLAALDATTGGILPWDPALSSVEWASVLTYPPVYSLAVAGSTLYAGGLFGRLGENLATSLAAVTFGPPPSSPSPIPRSLTLAPPMPNPIRASATIRFALPAASPVSLAVFDIQGRRVASLLDHALRPAGTNEVSLHPDGWREGFYFCRLEAGGATATQKMVVLK